MQYAYHEYKIKAHVYFPGIFLFILWVLLTWMGCSNNGTSYMRSHAYIFYDENNKLIFFNGTRNTYIFLEDTSLHMHAAEKCEILEFVWFWVSYGDVKSI